MGGVRWLLLRDLLDGRGKVEVKLKETSLFVLRKRGGGGGVVISDCDENLSDIFLVMELTQTESHQISTRIDSSDVYILE